MFQSKQVTFSPGQTAKISISARVLQTPSTLEGYSIQDRECRLKDEQPSSEDYLYSTYDPTLCQYSCSVQKTKKDFDCVPWDIVYPHKDKATRICYGQRAADFKKILENYTLSEPCEDCLLPRCHSFTYFSSVRLSGKSRHKISTFSFQVDVYLTDVYKECKDEAIYSSLQVKMTNKRMLVRNGKVSYSRTRRSAYISPSAKASQTEFPFEKAAPTINTAP